MIQSMTAFARHDRKESYGTLVWELRSVNHRYLETFVRLPEEFRQLEGAVRELIGGRLSRGKVECLLSVKKGTDGASLALNTDVAEKVSELISEIGRLFPSAAAPSPLEILKWPGVLETPGLDLERMAQDTLGLLNQAVDDLIATRMREGVKLREAMQERLGSMGVLVVQVRERLPLMLEGVKTRMLKRFAELSVTLDETRVEQEMVMLAQRTDVEEELKRLETHLSEVARILKSQDRVPNGRRLDFLMQELNREANTLCSKSLDTEITRAGIEMKVLIEQVREQVQNIE